MIIDTEKLKKAIRHQYALAGDAIEKNVKNNNRAIEMLNTLEKREIEEISCVEKIEKLSKHKYGSKTQQVPQCPGLRAEGEDYDR